MDAEEEESQKSYEEGFSHCTDGHVFQKWMRMKIDSLKRTQIPPSKPDQLIIVLGAGVQSELIYQQPSGRFRVPLHLCELPGSNVECFYILAKLFPNQVTVVSMLITAPLAHLEKNKLNNWFDLNGSITEGVGMSKMGYAWVQRMATLPPSVRRTMLGLVRRHGKAYATWIPDITSKTRWKAFDKGQRDVVHHGDLCLMLCGMKLDESTGYDLAYAFRGTQEEYGFLAPIYGVRIRELVIVGNQGYRPAQEHWLFKRWPTENNDSSRAQSTKFARLMGPLSGVGNHYAPDHHGNLYKTREQRERPRSRRIHTTFHMEGDIWKLFFRKGEIIEPLKPFYPPQREGGGFKQGLSSRFWDFKKLPVHDSPQRRQIVRTYHYKRRVNNKDVIISKIGGDAVSEAIVAALCLARYGEKDYKNVDPRRLDWSKIQNLLDLASGRSLTHGRIVMWLETSGYLNMLSIVERDALLKHCTKDSVQVWNLSLDASDVVPQGKGRCPWEGYETLFRYFIVNNYDIFEQVVPIKLWIRLPELIKEWKQELKATPVLAMGPQRGHYSVRSMLARFSPKAAECYQLNPRDGRSIRLPYMAAKVEPLVYSVRDLSRLWISAEELNEAGGAKRKFSSISI